MNQMRDSGRAAGAPPVRVVREDEIRRLARVDSAALAAIESAFLWLHQGRAIVPPVMIIEIPGPGEVDVKSAYVRELPSFTIKIAAGSAANQGRGLPASGGLMVVIDSESGLPRAVLIDNGYLTDLRTALAGAVAARYLAPEQVETVGLFGTGGQARWQIRALRLVRSFQRLLVCGRHEDAARRCAEDLRDEVGVAVELADARQTVEESQLVVTATSSREPLIHDAWLHPRLHITAVGSDAPGKREVHPAVLARVDRIVCDLVSQSLELGELQGGEGFGIALDRVVELGAIVGGSVEGRASSDEVTLCDLTGVGVQDTAIAGFLMEHLPPA